MLTTFTCIHKDSGEKIKYDDYKTLSDNEKTEYNVYPKMQVFRVFNVAQTNLQEARPELWQKLEKEYSLSKIENGEDVYKRQDVAIAAIANHFEGKKPDTLSVEQCISKGVFGSDREGYTLQANIKSCHTRIPYLSHNS